MKFRKKPVTIEAVQFKGSSTDRQDIQLWMDGGEYKESVIKTRDHGVMEIRTLEGTMRADPNDWIIKGVHGEFYLCKADIFEETYEAVE